VSVKLENAVIAALNVFRKIGYRIRLIAKFSVAGGAKLVCLVMSETHTQLPANSGGASDVKEPWPWAKKKSII
jgi:hypothetical protein